MMVKEMVGLILQSLNQQAWEKAHGLKIFRITVTVIKLLLTAIRDVRITSRRS